MKANIGIDIGKKKCDYCVVNGRGKVLERGQYPNTPRDAGTTAKKLKQEYGKGCRAACETTGNMWQITFDAFENAGIMIQLANTFKMAIIAKSGKKTDKVDAEKIANTLRMNSIPQCHVPPKDVRGLGSAVRQRVRMVQDRTRVINRVHSLLDRHELKIDASSMHTQKAMDQIETARLDNAHDEEILHRHGRQIRYLTGEIADMDQSLGADAAGNADAQLLASLTGMGIFTSLLLAVEIDTIERFDNHKKLVSWAGLCPVVYQSGDKKYTGRIKKLDTNSLVNWAMCEAANTAIRHDPRMAVIYKLARNRHAGRHAPAIILVAKKMIIIAWHILKTRKPYKTRNKELYARKLARLEYLEKSQR